MASPTWEQIAESVGLLLKSTPDEAMSVILQAAIEPSLPGHMSNERRVTRDKKRWLIEGFSRPENLRQQFIQAGSPGEEGPMMAENEKDVIVCLRKIAGMHSMLGSGQFHCEWVWDAKRVWIVQSDEAASGPLATHASIFLRAKENRPPRFRPESTITHFSDVSSDEWKKLRRPKEFEKLGFPVADVYLLTGRQWTTRKGKSEEALYKDLATMCKYPLVVRMDISTRLSQEDTFLPTSPAITNPNRLVPYLEQEAKKLSLLPLQDSDWAFLLANLVPARASAMVHARPKAQRVQIDGLWGFPDGLLHFPHDTWFYYPDGRVKEHRRHKSKCLIPKGDGWLQCDVGPPFDWQAVLSKEEVTLLGKWGLRLADHLGSEVQLMALARIGGQRGDAACLPWHYTTWSVPQYSQTLEVLPTLTQVETIRTRADLNPVFGVASQRMIRGYLIRPEESLLRSDEFLKECARYAAARQKPIYFEGSILSHAYYVMARTGATVVPIAGEEPKRDQKSYHKLVRDRIPIIIEKAGGLARVRHIPRSQARALLVQKLIEEAFEVRSAADTDLIEELADSLDVIDAIREHAGIDKEALDNVRAEKNAKRGGFKQLIYLEETSLQPLHLHADEEGKLPLFTEESLQPTPKVSLPGRRIQIHATSDPGDVIRFTVSLIPPVERGFGDQILQAKYGGHSVEIKYEQSEAILVVTKDRLPESPDQLMLFSGE